MPNGYRRHVLAHSQGSAVVAAGFRDYGLTARTWIVTQGAIPVSCYDPNPRHYVYKYFLRRISTWTSDIEDCLEDVCVPELLI